LDIYEALLVLALGFMVGMPSSMVGIGGGFLLVPALILLFQLPAKNAVAVSLVAICGTTFSSTIGYIRQGRVDYKLGLLYDVLDVPGIVVGAYITTLLPQNILAGVCGLFITALSLLVMKRKEKRKEGPRLEEEPKASRAGTRWRRKLVDSRGVVVEYYIRGPHLALVSSFLGGLVTGLSGLGGGITDVSTMILLGVPPHIAVASSEFAMAVTNGVGVVAHGLLNNILVEYALPIAIGTAMGAQVGCTLAKRVKGEDIRRMLSLIALFAGLRLTYSSFIG